MWTQFRVAGGSIQSQLYQTIVDDCFDSTDPRSALKSFLSQIIFCFPQTSIHCILYLYLYFVWSCFDDTDPRRRLLWRAFTNYFLLFPDFHSSLEPIMTSSLSFTVSTLASPSKQYMIYANNFWRKKTAERCIKSPNEINLSTPIYDLINGLCVLLSPSLSVFVFVYMYLNEWNNCCLNLCISLSLVICIPGSTPYLWKKRSTNRQLHLIFSASNVWVEDGPSPTTGSVFGWKCAKSESLNLRAKPSLSWASANNDATPREQEPTNRLLHLIFSSLNCSAEDDPSPSITGWYLHLWKKLFLLISVEAGLMYFL